jgi:hypothetical protein
MTMIRQIAAACMAATLTLAGAAQAQAPAPPGPAAGGPQGFSTTGQPTSFDVNGMAYVVDGYRSARWGMTIAQVRQIIPKDFPDAEIGVDTLDPVTRTTIVVIAAPQLSPGPGATAVSYIFGATSGRLIHVNVDWQYDNATPTERVVLTVAGSRVVADFISYYWKLLSVARGIPVGPNSLVLFAGAGEAGGAVEVRLQGIGYTVQTPNGVVEMPPPKGGQALLHVGYAQTDGQPDVYMIKPGEF